jgi:4-hydroxy-4-methyl-2-oxoglutarate aldolase
MDTAGIADRLRGLSASLIADAAEGLGVVSPGLIRLSGTATVAARAVTAACSEGSLQAIFAALDQATPGDILCVTGPGSSAYLGELIANDIVRRGLAGAVIDGFIRDRAAIAQLPASFFARGVTPLALLRQIPGEAMIPLSLGGVTVNPGDWIVADDDGVVAIGPDSVAEVLARAEKKAALEARILQLIDAGTKVDEAARQALAEAAARSG